MTSAAVRNILNSFLPNVYIGRVMLESASEDTLVSVTLSIKDLSTDNILSYWAKNRSVTDLLEIRYAVAMSPEEAESIRTSNPTLNMDSSVKSVDMSVLVDNFQNEAYKTLDGEGNEIITYNFQESFHIPNESKYLAVYACCRLKVDQFFNETKESLKVSQDVLDSLDPSLFAGKLSFNVVIENSSVVSYMPLYLDEETGEVWNGPVHRMGDNGRWMTGDDHASDSRFLILRNVPNTSVQDFRKSSELDGIDLSIFKTESSISNAFLKNVRGERVGVNNPKSYFSDILLSRDEMGKARFFFSVNYDRILEDNIAFGGLLRKSAPDTNLRDYCKITSMKIFRRRVEGSSEIGSKPFKTISDLNAEALVNFSPSTGPKVFDCNQVDKLIVSTGRISAGENARTVLGNELVGTVEEIDNLSISNAKGVRHFSGIDHSVEKVTDGFYQYRIEIEILDSSDNFVRDRLFALESAKGLMQSYLDAVLESRMSGRKSALSAFEGRSKEIQEAVLTYLNNLVLFTDSPMFSQTFAIRSLYTRILSWCNPRTPNGISKVVELIDNLVRRLTDIGGVTKRQPTTKTENSTKLVNESPSLQNYSAPKVAFKIENTFNSFFDSNISKDTYYNYMNALSKATDFGVKVMNNASFTGRVQEETEKISGTDEIDPDLELRVKGEILNPGDNFRNTDFTFFSPAEVKMPDFEPIKLIGSSPLTPLSAGTLKAYDMVKKGFGKPLATVSKGLETSDKKDAPVNINLAKGVVDKMSSFGVTISPPDIERSFDSDITEPVEKDRTNCNTSKEAEVEIAPVALYERIFDDINIDSRKVDGLYSSTGEPTRDTGKSTFKRNIRNASAYYDPENGDGFVAKFMRGFPTFTPAHLFLGAPHSNNLTVAEGYSKTVPNHIKSLTKRTSLPEDIQQKIMGMFSRGKVQTDSEFLTEIELKFLNLIAVQVLTGFEDTDKDGWVEPYLPVFQPLTRTLYNEAARNNGKLLCKIKNIENSMLNIRTPDDNFSIIDQYFIIEPAEVRPEVVTIDPTDLARGTTETTETIRGGRLGTGNRPTLDIDLSPPDTARTQVDPVDSFRETTETIRGGRLGTGNRPTLNIDLEGIVPPREATIDSRLLFNPDVELSTSFVSSPTLSFQMEGSEEDSQVEESDAETRPSPSRSSLTVRGGPSYGS